MKNFFRFHEFRMPSDNVFGNNIPRKHFLVEVLNAFSFYKSCEQFGRPFCGQ